MMDQESSRAGSSSGRLEPEWKITYVDDYVELV